MAIGAKYGADSKHFFFDNSTYVILLGYIHDRDIVRCGHHRSLGSPCRSMVGSGGPGNLSRTANLTLIDVHFTDSLS